MKNTSFREINLIVVHCTATPEGRDVTAADVDRWHRQRGFLKIGYHYLVRLDGSVETGRDENETGAHCSGHNSRSIGVVYAGGLDKSGRHPADTRTPAQREALIKLLRRLKARYPDAEIRSHRDFAPKACPCFDATAEYSCL
ncbi:MAG: N-acetylmuramoyl-L-alanine amidase [Odoribacter sp.]|nr:N-acetylmuramoyl-L-alanine amidase [Odoribacter sp.]